MIRRLIWYYSNRCILYQSIYVYYISQETVSASGSWFNIKMSYYQYRKSHCWDKTVLRPSYLLNGIPYTGKTTHSWLWRIDIGDILRQLLFGITCTVSYGIQSTASRITACCLPWESVFAITNSLGVCTMAAYHLNGLQYEMLAAIQPTTNRPYLTGQLLVCRIQLRLNVCVCFFNLTFHALLKYCELLKFNALIDQNRPIS